MKTITNTILWKAIQRYAHAQESESWSGSGDPANIPLIKKELEDSHRWIKLLVSIVTPVSVGRLKE